MVFWALSMIMERGDHAAGVVGEVHHTPLSEIRWTLLFDKAGWVT